MFNESLLLAAKALLVLCAVAVAVLVLALRVASTHVAELSS